VVLRKRRKRASHLRLKGCPLSGHNGGGHILHVQVFWLQRRHMHRQLCSELVHALLRCIWHVTLGLQRDEAADATSGARWAAVRVGAHDVAVSRQPVRVHGRTAVSAKAP
jgi:hypothetical protein